MASQKQSSESASLDIGRWLRRLRNERRLVLRQVAAAVDMDMAHLSKIELGDRLPTQQQAAALAHFYAVSINEMEAARMAGKILRYLRNHPAAPRAIEIVQENAAAYGLGKCSAIPRNRQRGHTPHRKAEV